MKIKVSKLPYEFLILIKYTDNFFKRRKERNKEEIGRTKLESV